MDLLPYLRFGVRGIQFLPSIPPGAVESPRCDDLPGDRGLGSAGDKASRINLGCLLGQGLTGSFGAFIEHLAGDNAKRPAPDYPHVVWDPGSACDPPERPGAD